MEKVNLSRRFRGFRLVWVIALGYVEKRVSIHLSEFLVSLLTSGESNWMSSPWLIVLGRSQGETEGRLRPAEDFEASCGSPGQEEGTAAAPLPQRHGSKTTHPFRTRQRPRLRSGFEITGRRVLFSSGVGGVCSRLASGSRKAAATGGAQGRPRQHGAPGARRLTAALAGQRFLRGARIPRGVGTAPATALGPSRRASGGRGRRAAPPPALRSPTGTLSLDEKFNPVPVERALLTLHPTSSALGARSPIPEASSVGRAEPLGPGPRQAVGRSLPSRGKSRPSVGAGPFKHAPAREGRLRGGVRVPGCRAGLTSSGARTHRDAVPRSGRRPAGRSAAGCSAGDAVTSLPRWRRR